MIISKGKPQYGIGALALQQEALGFICILCKSQSHLSTRTCSYYVSSLAYNSYTCQHACEPDLAYVSLTCMLPCANYHAHV